MDSSWSVTSLDGFIDYKTIEKIYYNRKSSLNLQTYACFSLSGYGGRHLRRHLENSKRSKMPAGHHSDSDSTLLSLLKSTITCFGGIFAR